MVLMSAPYRTEALRAQEHSGPDWTHRELTDSPVGAWKPRYDPVARREHGRLELGVQRCEQGDHEVTGAQPAYVLCLEP